VQDRSLQTACSHATRSWHDADADRGNGAQAQNGHAAAASQSAPGAYSQHVPEGSQPEAGSSPEADQSKLGRRADHSRHISWDDAFLETPVGNGILDSGSVCSRVLLCITNLLGLIGQQQSCGTWKHHLATDRTAAVLFHNCLLTMLPVVTALHRPCAEFACYRLDFAHKVFSGCMLTYSFSTPGCCT